MTQVLVVDDSRAVRSIITRQVTEWGFSFEEAEDGEDALARLKQSRFDLVLLDVTMPTLDGVAMLERLRKLGDNTPVILLTAESRAASIASALKLGISDYILKPFRPDDLQAKVFKALGLAREAKREGGGGAPASTAPSPTESAAGSRSVDILLIDDMENVHKKFRSVLPQEVTLDATDSPQAAITLCRERQYRLVIIDLVMPGSEAPVLLNQLRMFQEGTPFLALSLRTASEAERAARDQGFDGVVFKPFAREEVEELRARYFDVQEIVIVKEDLISIAAFTAREDKLDRYFGRVAELCEQAFSTIASACFDEAIVDLTPVPPRPDKLVRLAADLEQEGRGLGVGLKLVGTPEIAKLLASFTDTSAIPFFPSVDQARTGGAT